MKQARNPEVSVAPISPDEVIKLQKELLPPEVIETFNRFIGENALNGYAIVRQDEVIKELVEKGLDRAQIFKRGWLNVEGMYEEAGWNVEYDKPGYNETYPATFTFKAPKK